MTLQQYLARHPVFTLQMLESAFPTLTPLAIRKRLGRQVANGDVVRLKRDLFAAVPPDVEREHFVADRFQVLAAWTPDAVFCGHSALELHGVAYSQWDECTSYTNGGRHAFQAQGTQYRLLRNPSELLRVGRPGLGVRSYDRGGVFVTGLGPERALVEGFRSSKLFGGLAEFLTSAKSYQIFDWDLLHEVLRAFSEKKVFAAVGWFLESQAVHLGPPQSLLAALEARQPTSPVYLERGMGAAAKVSRWNLLVPERLTQMEDRDAPES